MLSHFFSRSTATRRNSFGYRPTRFFQSIDVRVGHNMIESVITRRSADELQIKIDDTLTAIIKSTEVMIKKD
jgi:molybdopterin-binding protein